MQINELLLNWFQRKHRVTSFLIFVTCIIIMRLEKRDERPRKVLSTPLLLSVGFSCLYLKSEPGHHLNPVMKSKGSKPSSFLVSNELNERMIRMCLEFVMSKRRGEKIPSRVLFSSPFFSLFVSLKRRSSLIQMLDASSFSAKQTLLLTSQRNLSLFLKKTSSRDKVQIRILESQASCDITSE